MALYTIQDIAEACGVSKQAVYKLISKHSQLVDECTVKRGRKVFYSQPLVNLCLTHYKGEQSTTEGAESGGKPRIDAGAAAVDNQLTVNYSQPTVNQPTAEVDRLTAEIDKLTAEVDKLKKKNKRLKATVKELENLLENSEAERAELIKQNGIALLALSQEKQEKRLLLPEPRKTLGEKVKGLFSRKDKDSKALGD